MNQRLRLISIKNNIWGKLAVKILIGHYKRKKSHNGKARDRTQRKAKSLGTLYENEILYILYVKLNRKMFKTHAHTEKGGKYIVINYPFKSI